MPDHYCLADRAAPADEPFTLSLKYAGCFCEETATCEVTGIASGLIELRTELCGSPALCGECVPEVEARCEIPALLGDAEYELRVNGDSLGLLPIYARTRPSTLSPRCTTLARPDGCSGSEPIFESSPDRFSRVCVQAEGDHEWLHLFDDCAECPAYHGVCDAQVIARTDRFFPPGADIHLDARIYPGACDGVCEDICHFDERRCPLPPLRAGDFYRVFVGDEVVHEFTGGERTCE